MSFEVIDHGLSDYETVWEEQKKLQQELISGSNQQYLIACSHNPVITLGRSANRENIIANESLLKENNIEVKEIERGGDITYHDQNQVVLYPILNLNNYKRDVDWYLRQLEEVVINTLGDFEIKSQRIEGKTGIWIKDQSERKIASLGIRISRWCTMHGLALNVGQSDGFNLIVPCGLQGVQMTSIAEELSSSEPELLARAKERLIDNFLKIFAQT